MIYFVFGASGAGKSAILSTLKSNNPNLEFHDFDDIGVPENADKVWHQQATNDWIVHSKTKTQDTCICGGAVPAEVISTSALATLADVRFCLLDCSDMERIRRLTIRNTYGPNQDIINWASWLRIHANLPTWESRVITEDFWPGMNFSHWLSLKEWPSTLRPHIIDTTKLSIPEVVQKVTSWINEDCQ